MEYSTMYGMRYSMTTDQKRVFRKMNFSELEYWYNIEFSEAFVENERKPFQDIITLIKENKYEVWGIFEGNHLLGYASLWKSSHVPLILLDYLGVSAKLRNGGIGAQILKYLKDLNTPIVTESELPVEGDSENENNIRVRRINFYKRNGFIPAYEMATCGMRWQALLINANNIPVESIMKWHKALYGAGRTDVEIPLEKGKTPGMPYWMEMGE